MKWLRKLMHRFDHVCPECQQIRVPFWKSRCAVCDEDEGVLK